METNPYQPSPDVDFTLRTNREILHTAFGVIAILLGVAIFGLGLYAAWLIATIAYAHTTAGLSRLMIAVTAMYLLFGLSFFASARFTFQRRTGLGILLFIIPFAIFGTLLSVFGI